MANRTADTQHSDAQVLSAALARIANLWGLSDSKLGAVLGLSPATASRILDGRTVLDPASKSFEAARLLLRLFRGLDALMGSDNDAARRWLAARNVDLDARPLDLIDSFRGLIAVCDYVDAHRVHA